MGDGGNGRVPLGSPCKASPDYARRATREHVGKMHDEEEVRR